MEQFNAIIGLIGTGSPAISVLAIIAAVKVYRDMMKLIERTTVNAEKQIAATERVAVLLEHLRDMAKPS